MAKAKTTDPVNSNLIQKISVDHLFFDPDNPRLPEEVDGSDETAVLRWLLNEGNGLLPELMGSIAQQGFFPGEPLLVAPRGPKHPDDYVVVEGNRRLAAVKLILAPSKAEKYTKTVNDTADSCKNPAALQMLPSVVYPTRDSVLRYLGFRHVTGVKEWGALAKAKYLRQLFEFESKSEPETKKVLKVLARTIGSRPSSVAKLLSGLKVYDTIDDNNYFGIEGLDEGEINFSLLTTALSYSNISKFIGLESPSDMELKDLKKRELGKLTKWIFERNGGTTRIGESRRLKELNAVVDSPKALEQFDVMNKPLSEAVQYTGLPIENFRGAVTLATRQTQLAYDMLVAIDEGLEEIDRDSTKELKNRSRDLSDSINRRLDELED